MDIKILEEEIINVCIKIAKRGEGAMFILGDNLTDFEFLVNQEIKRFNIIDNPKTTESLALQDGAVWIDTNGFIKGYAIAMTRIIPERNRGTRHASAVYASKNGNKVFLVSQEEKIIKIYYKSSLLMEINSLKEKIEYKTKEVVNILENMGIGGMATIATATASPALYNSIFGLSQTTPLGLAILPGIVVFGSIGYIIRLLAKIKR